jgi:outer membrane protein assembly factor BamD
MGRRAGYWALVLILAVSLGGCSSTSSTSGGTGVRGRIKNWFSKEKPDKPPEVMAEEGIKELKKKKYDDAIETFGKLKDRYPYSDQAMLAQIKVADAQFYKKKYEEALQSYKEFEKLHPTNKAVPYAIFRQGMCYFRQRSTIDRDQTFTHKAIEEFRRLIKKFPDSEYVPRAEKYIVQCRKDLAEHEFYVGEFYFRTRRYSSALERFQNLLQEYPEFPRQAQVKSYISQSQEFVANPDKRPQRFMSRFTTIFDADW